MADGSPQPDFEPTGGGIVKDPVDLRDCTYEPALARLAPILLPDRKVIAALRRATKPWLLPRLQGGEGTCGGQALAALIDLERLHAGAGEPYSVSARMLYECARLKNDAIDGDGVSLRDVIKAFYNYGACREELWPYEPNPADPGALTYTSARDAKQLSLGAYYRLRPNLNSYHAALHETGAVIVSAALHDGWSAASVRANAGRIEPPAPGEDGGNWSDHAFLIVGYTPDGFLVLNSWGRDWGGWRPPDGRRRDGTPRPERPVPGVALWTYADWADRIIDGWVLRLGVGAAESFDYSIGDMGLGFGADTSVRSTPVHTILGNFLHLDDGDYVASGAFVSTERTLLETEKLLTEAPKDPGGKPPAKGVLLTFAGALQGLKEAAEQVARWKRLVRDKDWHPFTVLWCVDYVEQSRAVLDSVFREAEARTGRPGALLDRIVEQRAHGIGRALWRDIGAAAERSARFEGPLHQITRAGARIAAARPGFGLRIVSESEGAIALLALMRAMRTGGFADVRDAFFGMLESVDIVAPPMPLHDYLALARIVDAGWGEAHPDRRIRLHLPTAAIERRLAVPPYGRSYFELVRNAFERKTAPQAGRADRAAAATADAPEIAAGWEPWGAGPRTELVPIRWTAKGRPDPQGPITQIELIYRSDVAGRLRTVLQDQTERVPELLIS